MDPLSQGAIGAAAAQAFSKQYNKTPFVGFFAGWLAGMAPDLDIFIRSSTDPLLFLEYHRHFTHALLFIPVGALFVAGVLYYFFKHAIKKEIAFKALYGFSFLGMATHGPLDAMTSYGTQLYWPFTNTRVAWDLIGIIDPVFSLALLIGVALSLIKKTPVYARVALVFCGLYFVFMGVQQGRALKAQEELLARNQIAPETIIKREAKPTIFNAVLWKVITKTNNRIYVDAVWTLPFFESKLYPGESVEAFEISKAFPRLDLKSTQAQDIARFAWFSQDYLAFHPEQPSIIGDMRYSFIPNRIEPLWGIRVNPDTPNQHTPYITLREVNDETKQIFQKMLRAQDIEQKPLKPASPHAK